MHFLFGLNVMCAIKTDSYGECWGMVEAGLGAGVVVEVNSVSEQKPKRMIGVGHLAQVKMPCHTSEAGCAGGDGIIRKGFLSHLLFTTLA